MSLARESDVRIIIVGGGATGALLACHLLRDPARAVHVTIIERAPCAGLGIAYSTANPHHLLNVRASNMSAFPDQPDHFWNWMVANNLHEMGGCDDAFCFVPRAIYGRYLASLLATYLDHRSTARRLAVMQGECVSLQPTQSGVEAIFSDGSSRLGDIAVLATGNEPPTTTSEHWRASPWQDLRQADVMPDDAVLILGSGLTMADYVLSLLQAGHRGPILAISRHGQLPRVHRSVEPLRIDAAEVPFAAEVSQFLRWLRKLIERFAPECDWRTVIDGLRPFTQEIWQNWPEPAKRRFLRHARSWWDVHRHRTAPEVDRRLRDALSAGQLKVVAGKVSAIESRARGATVRYRRRGSSTVEAVHVAKVVECVGVDVNFRKTANPVLRSLLEQGLARPDPIGIGIDVTADCAIIDRSGEPSGRLLAVGPLTRGMFWEIVAIPDIRMQCSRVARRIAARAMAAAE
jgi:uncharacterized NAD(P)/FAD-binding protein YdhS